MPLQALDAAAKQDTTWKQGDATEISGESDHDCDEIAATVAAEYWWQLGGKDSRQTSAGRQAKEHSRADFHAPVSRSAL